jgi:hypothetical protein
MPKTIHYNHNRRVGSLLLALVFVATIAMTLTIGLVPGVSSKTFAYGEVTSRSIEIGSSQINETAVSYQVQFTTTSSIQSVAIDFCAQSPLYQDTCSAVPGFSASSAGFTAGTGTTGWGITATAGHVDVHGAPATGTVSFTLTNITNPSGTGAFYARIYDYTANPDDYTSPSSPGTVADFGGIALSTANVVNVTARVQEELSFCVSGAAFTGNGCAGMTAPNLTIGHGSPTLILDSTAVDTTPAYTQTSTNAQAGVAIRMKNSNSCAGLSADGGATCSIPPAGASPTTFTAGTADYGMDIATSTGGLGTVAPTAPYSTAGQYAMDNTSAPNNVSTTYGSQIASCSGAVSNTDNTLTFAATASNTTPAGIYTAGMTLIATGTF